MAALESLEKEAPQALEVKDIVDDDVARANRDRYHWSEVDLGSPGGWLKDWCELNLDGQVIYETEAYKVRPRVCFSLSCVASATRARP